MTIQQWLASTTRRLEAAGIGTARLDCLVLLEDCLNTNRAQVLAYPHLLLMNEQIKALEMRATRRGKHEPLAYIRGHAEFYGRTFFVDRRVLIPRPETEAMIEAMKNLQGPQTLRIADIGTGSGCIGITAALELPKTEVALFDIDAAALAVAHKNATNLGANVSSYKSDLLDGLADAYDVLLANLPYVPSGKLENIDASFEPARALFAGSDGLDVYRKFWGQVKGLHWQPRYILAESATRQHPVQRQLAQTANYRLNDTTGFIQTFKLI